MSRSAAARLCAQGNVASGGKALSKKDSVRANHSVTVILPPIASCEAEPEDIPLDVIYEDSDIIVINKPSGMVVHPAPGHYSGTLVSALLYRCGSELSGIGGVARPGIVHRIDRQTTGLIAAAKNDFAHERLSAQLADHSMSREYRALVVGHMKEMCGTVDAPIARSTRDRKKMAIAADGRSARTHYRVDEEFPQCSLLTLNLETGRTHQIRVHMAYLGHPVLGDPVYGGDGAAFVKKHPSLFDGQMLHAQSLTLTHPRTGEKDDVSRAAARQLRARPLDPAQNAAADRLRGSSLGRAPGRRMIFGTASSCVRNKANAPVVCRLRKAVSFAESARIAGYRPGDIVRRGYKRARYLFACANRAIREKFRHRRQ